MSKPNTKPNTVTPITKPTIASELERMQAEVERLRAENAKLSASKGVTTGTLSMRVAQSGGLSIYGLGRFPVTLHAGQWERLLAIGGDIAAFIGANKGKSFTVPHKVKDKDTGKVTTIGTKQVVFGVDTREDAAE